MTRHLTFVCALLLATATAAYAQDPATGRQAPPSGSPDFFFGEPKGSIGVRGSWVFASAGSDLFKFVERHLTVDKKDFNAPAFGLDVAVAVTSRMSARFDFESSQTQKESEYRDFVDNKLLPINQKTALQMRGVSGNVRFNLTPAGRRVSRYAWIPKGATPYVGAGGGALWYNFEQNGDFVDFVDHSVFFDHFSSSGWTPSAYVFGGTDLHLYRILFLTVEGRYVWANAKLSKDFVDFDPIDLAGFRLSTGINVALGAR